MRARMGGARPLSIRRGAAERSTRGSCVPRVPEAQTARAIWLCECARGAARLGGGLDRFPSGAVANGVPFKQEATQGQGFHPAAAIWLRLGQTVLGQSARMRVPNLNLKNK
ncbi:hypothetical protein NDU88_008040 [Pleurodeles waltl]|uniref:Uncharacterized protein n=1 Tax=Pleurodeles waltl TaxID=8319 RepID=A0AAV7P3U8_PLEWA|nr:hypothetical protein NDU88_008040 [Pleurodeles waltl]